jgi:hypothetical protein
MDKGISEYNSEQDTNNRSICERLAGIVQENLAGSTSKVWHGGPVWFIDDNPIVGYWVRKDGVRLLFWSGQSFTEPGLAPEGKFKAAEAKYSAVGDIDVEQVKAWLKESETVQWDYKNIVKRRGELVRLK